MDFKAMYKKAAKSGLLGTRVQSIADDNRAWWNDQPSSGTEDSAKQKTIKKAVYGFKKGE